MVVFDSKIYLVIEQELAGKRNIYATSIFNKIHLVCYCNSEKNIITV